MIQITHDGSAIRITISPRWPLNGRTFTAGFDGGSDWAAALLVDNLRERMRSELNRIRSEAYAEGWKDAKAKKGAKQTWFSGAWE